MHITTYEVIDMQTGEVLEHEGFEYFGPISECKGGSKTEKTTEVTTKTVTDIRDIGLTGKQFKDVATGITKGAIESEKLRTRSLDRLVQQVGENYSQLVGGAGKITDTAESVGKEVLETSESASKSLVTKGQQQAINLQKQAGQQAKSILRQAGAISEEQVDRGTTTEEILPWIVALATVFMLVRGRS